MIKENKTLKGIINKKYERSLWDGFKEGVGIFFIGVALIILLASIIYIFTVLIENPITIAIICITILLYGRIR